jgi:myo-inositol-1-phosphate synthase
MVVLFLYFWNSGGLLLCLQKRKKEKNKKKSKAVRDILSQSYSYDKELILPCPATKLDDR